MSSRLWLLQATERLELYMEFFVLYSKKELLLLVLVLSLLYIIFLIYAPS